MPALDYLNTTLTVSNESTSYRPTDKLAKLVEHDLPQNKFDNLIDTATNLKPISPVSESSTPIIDYTSQIYRSSNHSPAGKEKELQWWYGTITEVLETSFFAQLKDIEGRLNIVEFDISIVPENSRDRILTGASLTYKISSRESRFGGLEYITKINISKKQSWNPKYEKHVQNILDQYLPKDLLNL